MNNRSEIYLERFSRMIRKETVSAKGQTDLTKFREFHELLKELFPALFTTCEVEDFDGSLLIKWEGRDSSRLPLLFMNHHDVVEAPGEWKYGAFDGICADGKLWGRGTLDTKGGLYSMLQAADELCEEGFVPEQTIYFESSCNEETDGTGAQAIAAELAARGIKFRYILDEGGMIMYDPIGGADGVFAMVGMGEKGCADLKFTAKSSGGHASTPGKNTPLVRLGKFMAACEKEKLFDVEISSVIEEMFRRFAPYMKGVMKTVFSHPKGFAPVIRKVMPGVSPTAEALLQTTIAFTMSRGSDGANVLPQEAWLIGNMRFSHHQGREDSIAKVKALAEKFDIETEVLEPGFSSRLSDPMAPEFEIIGEAVEAIFKDVKAVPYIMTGGSDCRFFTDLSENCYRFVPFTITKEQMASIHGLNENVDVSCLEPAVDFYKYLMKK